MDQKLPIRSASDGALQSVTSAPGLLNSPRNRPGQVAPMALLSYEDALGWAETNREVVQEGRMPPWHADRKIGHFANDRRLSKEDRDTLLAWIKQDCPKGDPRELPPPRRFPKEWSIGKPDVVLSMSQKFNVPAKGGKNGITAASPGGQPHRRHGPFR